MMRNYCLAKASSLVWISLCYRQLPVYIPFGPKQLPADNLSVLIERGNFTMAPVLPVLGQALCKLDWNKIPQSFSCLNSMLREWNSSAFEDIRALGSVWASHFCLLWACSAPTLVAAEGHLGTPDEM